VFRSRRLKFPPVRANGPLNRADFIKFSQARKMVEVAIRPIKAMAALGEDLGTGIGSEPWP